VVSARTSAASGCAWPRACSRNGDESGWPLAERFAVAVLTESWETELAAPCARALGDAHELALVQAQRCLDATHDLEERGAGSWIAAAVLHQLAFDVAWDVLAGQDGEPREEGCPEARSG
jgi:hypothetical protein